MRRMALFLLIVGLGVCAGLNFSAALGQEETDDVRGAFLTTRPKKNDKPVAKTQKPNRRRPKPVVSTPPPTTTTTSATPTKVVDTTPPKTRAPKIGMGMTLFMRDSNGLSVRVNPSRQFYQGERVRLLLETNTDGYLYVFNTTNDGPPVMIYPDADLDEGGNYIQAHMPVEIPSSVAAEERLKWFRFDAQAGVERLYFVFTREPLGGIPLEDELISFCREQNSNCPMKPTVALWDQIRKDTTPVKGAKSEVFGTVETSNEHQATTRGIGLSKEDPEPSLVMMTASSGTNILVTTLDLTHK